MLMWIVITLVTMSCGPVVDKRVVCKPLPGRIVLPTARWKLLHFTGVEQGKRHTDNSGGQADERRFFLKPLLIKIDLADIDIMFSLC